MNVDRALTLLLHGRRVRNFTYGHTDLSEYDSLFGGNVPVGDWEPVAQLMMSRKLPEPDGPLVIQRTIENDYYLATPEFPKYTTIYPRILFGRLHSDRTAVLCQNMGQGSARLYLKNGYAEYWVGDLGMGDGWPARLRHGEVWP